jgi:hypothetical protein
MALADPIFTVDGWFRLILADFDLVLIFLALKVALGLEEIYFWAIKKNN